MKREVIPPDPATRKRVVIFFGIACLWSFLCLIILIPIQTQLLDAIPHDYLPILGSLF
jgi:hypothetical protein